MVTVEERLSRLEGVYDHLASKADLAALRGEVKADLADLRGELKADTAELQGELKADTADLRGDLKAAIASLEMRMTVVENRFSKWMVVMQFLSLGAILGGVAAMIRLLT